MHVLITGAKGQVGQELVRLAPSHFKVSGFSSQTLDITQPSNCHMIRELKPDVIINAAAYTAVDQAETHQKQALAVNYQGAKNLALIAQTLDIPLLHISTDYVFDGTSSTPYTESASTNPQSVYGLSKLKGEHAIQATHKQHIILRTSWVFGALGQNFVKTMLRLATSHSNLRIVSDQIGNPTSAASIARALWSLVARYESEQTLPWGIYNFSNQPSCSWYDFAQEIFNQAKALDLINQMPTLEPIRSEQYPTPAKRPHYSVLDNQKLSSHFNFKNVEWKHELSSVLGELRTGQQ